MDTTAIMGFVNDAQTAAVAIGIAVTILIFAIKATKWLRRAG